MCILEKMFGFSEGIIIQKVALKKNCTKNKFGYLVTKKSKQA